METQQQAPKRRSSPSKALFFFFAALPDNPVTRDLVSLCLFVSELIDWLRCRPSSVRRARSSNQSDVFIIGMFFLCFNISDVLSGPRCRCIVTGRSIRSGYVTDAMRLNVQRPRAQSRRSHFEERQVDTRFPLVCSLDSQPQWQ